MRKPNKTIGKVLAVILGVSMLATSTPVYASYSNNTSTETTVAEDSDPIILEDNTPIDEGTESSGNTVIEQDKETAVPEDISSDDGTDISEDIVINNDTDDAEKTDGGNDTELISDLDDDSDLVFEDVGPVQGFLVDGNVTASGKFESGVRLSAEDVSEDHQGLAESGQSLLFAYDISYTENSREYTHDGDVEYTVEASVADTSALQDVHVYFIDGTEQAEIADPVLNENAVEFTSDKTGIFACVYTNSASANAKKLQRIGGPRRVNPLMGKDNTLNTGSEVNKIFSSLAGGLGNIRYIKTTSSKPAGTGNAKCIGRPLYHVHDSSCTETVSVPAPNPQSCCYSVGTAGVSDRGYTFYHWKCSVTGEDLGLTDNGPPSHYHTSTEHTCGKTEGVSIDEWTPIYAAYEAGTKTIWIWSSRGLPVNLNSNSNSLFANMSNLQDLDLRNWNATTASSLNGMFTGCSSLKTLTIGTKWKFATMGNSGLKDAAYPSEADSGFWHREEQNTDPDGYKGTDANGNPISLGVKVVPENRHIDRTSKGLESFYNDALSSGHASEWAGTWVVGRGTLHQYHLRWGGCDGMIEVHHPERPFTTYCWAQHRGPNYGYYDRYEVLNEDQMEANLRIFHQNYHPLPSEKYTSQPMLRTFIALMYFGNVDSDTPFPYDPLGITTTFGISRARLQAATQHAVWNCSDGWGYNDPVTDYLMANARYDKIPEKYRKTMHFYVYLYAADEGAGQQQMGIDSLQLNKYGGLDVQKVDKDTGKGVSGAQITVKDANGKIVAQGMTDKDGGYHICDMSEGGNGLLPGTYYVSETKAPTGYNSTSDVFKVNVVADKVTSVGYKNDGTTLESIVFANKRPYPAEDFGSLRITKQSTSAGNATLAGAKFEIYAAADITMKRYDGGTDTIYTYHDGDDPLYTVYSDAEGVAGLSNIPNGTYIIKEAKAPDGYKLNRTPETVTIGVNAGGPQSVSVTFSNEPKSCQYYIKAHKDIPDGYAWHENGFQFQLYQMTGRLGSDGKPELGQKVGDPVGIDENGDVTWGPFTYTTVEAGIAYQGEVQYAIKEVIPDDEDQRHYQYDHETRYAYGEVMDEPGTDYMTMEMKYPNNRDAVIFTNTYIVPPTITNPNKTVSQGKTIVQDLHNEVIYAEQYQYDVYQPIPQEREADYYKSFKFHDVFPAGIFVRDVKVYKKDANGAETEVTDKFKILTTHDNPAEAQDTQFTVDAEYTGSLDDAAFYNSTYDFRFAVVIGQQVNSKTTYVNNAETAIVYKDPENHYILKKTAVPVLDELGKPKTDDNGDPVTEDHMQVVKNGDGNPIYETGTWADNTANGTTDTSRTQTTDASKAVHFMKTNDVLTDVYPSFDPQPLPDPADNPDPPTPPDPDHYPNKPDNPDDPNHTGSKPAWTIWKEVYDADGRTINIENVKNGEILTYKITVENRLDRTDGHFNMTDAIPNGVTYIAGTADNSGSYDEASNTLSWSNLELAKSSKHTVIFQVKVNGVKEFIKDIDNDADATIWPDGGRKNDNGTPQDTNSQTSNKVHNWVPDIVKAVTDGDGNNIDTQTVPDGTRLYYHIFVTNPDTANVDTSNGTYERTGIHTFTTSDVVPENSILIGKITAGRTVSALPSKDDKAFTASGLMPADKYGDLADMIPAKEGESTVTWTEAFQPQETKEYIFIVEANGSGVTIENEAETRVGTKMNQDGAPEEPGSNVTKVYKSNKVVNYTPLTGSITVHKTFASLKQPSAPTDHVDVEVHFGLIDENGKEVANKALILNNDKMSGTVKFEKIPAGKYTLKEYDVYGYMCKSFTLVSPESSKNAVIDVNKAQAEVTIDKDNMDFEFNVVNDQNPNIPGNPSNGTINKINMKVPVSFTLTCNKKVIGNGTQPTYTFTEQDFDDCYVTYQYTDDHGETQTVNKDVEWSKVHLDHATVTGLMNSNGQEITLHGYYYTMDRSFDAKFKVIVNLASMKEYRVTYEANGGRFPYDGELHQAVYIYDSTNDKLYHWRNTTFAVPVSTSGKTFSSWTTAIDGSGTKYSTETAIKDLIKANPNQTEAFKLYAQWN